MSSYLYRLGHALARRAVPVLAAWLVLLLGGGALALVAGGQLEDDLTIPGTEAQAGLDVLERQFPEAAGTSGQLLFTAPESIGEHRREIRRVLAGVERLDHVVLAADPFAKDQRAVALADDDRHALVQVQLDLPLEDVDEATVASLTQAAQDLPAGSTLEVDLGGSLFTTTTVHLSAVEALGVVAALVVLAVTFGSLLAAGMPILTAVLGVGVSMAGVMAVAAVTEINSSTPTLALMIGLAVGIDYALFIVSRHRSQLAAGLDVAESVARSLATAGSAVVFAGATVVIALVGLVVARIPFLTVMGLAAAATVAVAVAVALTAVPALLVLAGDRLRPGRSSRAARHAGAGTDASTLGGRWVALVTRVPALTVAVVVVGLALAAMPAKDLALGLPDNGTAPAGATERVTYDKVTEVYGAGYNAPLLVTVDIIRTTDPVGVMDRIGRDLGRIDGVEAVALSTPNPKADLGIVQVVPEHAQADPATADLVRTIRARAGVLEERYDVDDLRVTGHTAVTIDVSDRLAGALLPFGLVVVGLSLVLLTMVFRSVAVPLKATLGYLLSVGASFGAVGAVFQWGWLADATNVERLGPVISFMPIILMGVLFGLAMDYEVFLVSRMREEYVQGAGASQAVRTGFAASSRVVTAAAVIMIAVFVAFVPNGDAAVKPIALGLAVGVSVDAFLVRMTLVPAVLALLGDRAWWLPSWLDRRLPHLDVEGAGLARHLEHEAWTRREGPAAVRAEGLRLVDARRATVLDGVDLLVRPGTLTVVRGDDRLARRALLTALAGRLDLTDGRLVVLDRVLPEQAAAVRRQVLLLERFPAAETLTAVARRCGPGGLVLVDDVDVLASEEEVAHRWRLLHDLVARGCTVVAGSASDPVVADPVPPDPVPADPVPPQPVVPLTTTTQRAQRPLRPATEEARL